MYEIKIQIIKKSYKIWDTRYKTCNQLVSTKSQFSSRAIDDTAPIVVEVSLVLLDQEKGEPEIICEVSSQGIKCLVAPENV